MSRLIILIPVPPKRPRKLPRLYWIIFALVVILGALDLIRVVG
jgi:hypothetical protein